MNQTKSKRIKLISLFFLAFCCLSCATGENSSDRSIGTKIDDRFLESVIKRELSKRQSFFKGSNINVTVFDGRVLLTGQVPNSSISEEARNVASSLFGVENENISNHLKIMGPISLISRSNDSWLTTKVKARLLSSKKTNGASLRVTCENGTIYLMGRVTREQSELFTNLISGIFGVEKIVKVFTYL